MGDGITMIELFDKEIGKDWFFWVVQIQLILLKQEFQFQHQKIGNYLKYTLKKLY